MTDAELGGELTGAPVSRSIDGRPPRGLQDAGFRPRGLPLGGLPPMAAVQPGQPFVSKAPPPQGYKTAAASDLGTDGIPGLALGEQQNHPGTAGVLSPPRSALDSSHQCTPFQFGQCHGVLHEHQYSLQIAVTVN